MRKISSKKIISLFVAVIAVIGIFTYTKSSLANANSDQDQANASVNLNVEKIDKDTVKISLDNLIPVVKSLQLGVKIDGDVTFAEDTIKWLVSSDDEELKSNVKISSDKKSMDIFVVSTEALEKDAGKLEILEIDINKVTGYIRGGCSPVGMKKLYGTFVNETAQNLDTIIVSAGKIGYQIELKPADLQEVTNFEYADVIH